MPGEGVIAEEELRAYECDGLTAYQQLPMIVVLPETTAQVSEILKYCHGKGIKIVPRGAGTSLSGGRCRSKMGSRSALASSTAFSISTMTTAA